MWVQLKGSNLCIIIFINIEYFWRKAETWKSNILMYTTEGGITTVEVTFDHDTVLLSLDQIAAELFQRNKFTISRHIKKIFQKAN